MFYTRIPVPRSVAYSDENLNKSTGYLPFVGILVGAIGGAVYFGAHYFLPVSISVILCMIATILLTGAFHEDAIADFCDGFGGGYTKDSILIIMKDSHIGTYGAIGLILTLASRFLLLSNIDVTIFFAAFIAGNAISRLNAVLLIFSSDYVRKDDDSKSKAVGNKHNVVTLILALIFGLVPFIFIPVISTLIIIPALVLTMVVFRWYVNRKIGGYTGDVLGALQQISELIFYLALIISINIK